MLAMGAQILGDDVKMLHLLHLIIRHWVTEHSLPRQYYVQEKG